VLTGVVVPRTDKIIIFFWFLDERKIVYKILNFELDT